ncbi:MAG: hypothetical protein PHV21_02070 [Synergistaceae bacterium]|nr:hypothetical protein [Synergistaceae bacterium]
MKKFFLRREKKEEWILCAYGFIRSYPLGAASAGEAETPQL